MKYHTITGHFRDESGLLSPGSLVVCQRGDEWFPAELSEDFPTSAREYRVTEDIIGVEIGDAFVPDEGECERVGMPIERLDDPR